MFMVVAVEVVVVVKLAAADAPAAELDRLELRPTTPRLADPPLALLD